jgi:hypothetical protein
MFRYLAGTKSAIGSSSSLPQLDEVASLRETLDGLDALLNDDLVGRDLLAFLTVGAEKILGAGSSAFHKTGHASVSFLRGLIGFEQDMLKEGSTLSSC